MALTKGKLKSIRSAIDEALAPIGKKHGVTLSVGSMTYADTHFRARLDGQVIGEATREQADYDERQPHLGLPKRGNTVELHGEYYEVVGWNRNAPKYPVQLAQNGRLVRKATPEAIRKAVLNEQS